MDRDAREARARLAGAVVTPATLAHARQTRAYFEEKIVAARQARDWERVRALDQRLSAVNEAIRQHFVEEARAAERPVTPPPAPSTDVPLF